MLNNSGFNSGGDSRGFTLLCLLAWQLKPRRQLAGLSTVIHIAVILAFPISKFLLLFPFPHPSQVSQLSQLITHIESAVVLCGGTSLCFISKVEIGGGSLLGYICMHPKSRFNMSPWQWWTSLYMSHELRVGSFCVLLTPVGWYTNTIARSPSSRRGGL